jgi:hypothetical protein
VRTMVQLRTVINPISGWNILGPATELVFFGSPIGRWDPFGTNWRTRLQNFNLKAAAAARLIAAVRACRTREVLWSRGRTRDG